MASRGFPGSWVGEALYKNKARQIATSQSAGL